MKSQDMFSLKNKKENKMSSAAIVIGTLRVNALPRKCPEVPATHVLVEIKSVRQKPM